MKTKLSMACHEGVEELQSISMRNPMSVDSIQAEVLKDDKLRQIVQDLLRDLVSCVG